MKLSELARYWAAKELTRLTLQDDHEVTLDTLYACPDFTFEGPRPAGLRPWQEHHGTPAQALTRVDAPLHLTSGTWCERGDKYVAWPRDRRN